VTGRGTIVRVVVAALLVGLVAGCGLTAESKPRIIAAKDLPSELLNPAASSTTLARSPSTTSVAVYYLVQTASTTHLAGVVRQVKDSSRASDRLTALLAAPTPQEQTQGLVTSIPAGTTLRGTKLSANGQELDIDLSSSLFNIQGQELRNAFAQLVWTATEIPGITQVRFTVEGKDFRVPDQDGIEQPGAVTRAAYARLAPIPPPTTSVATSTTVERK
jgi:spore germination protein GerM